MSDFYSDLEDGELFSICDDYAEDLKYRSIAVEARPTFGPSREYYAPAPAPAFTFVSKTAKTSSASFTSGCPSIPYGVAKTNFGIDKTDYASVVRSIEENLLRQINFDFSYWETDFMVNIPTILHITLVRFFLISIFFFLF